MIVKNLQDCDPFISGDRTVLRELLHPDKDPIAIRYSLAESRLAPGMKALPHRLKTSEVYFILEGRGLMHIDREAREVRSGQAVYIPPGSRQFIENPGDVELVFLCIVDPAWRPEDEEISDPES
ncbi:MAG: cupin domain-containing protein [Candidatus Aminicenantales bacterium]